MLQHSTFLNIFIVVDQSSQIGMGVQWLHVLGCHVTPKPVLFGESRTQLTFHPQNWKEFTPMRRKHSIKVPNNPVFFWKLP